MGLVINNVEGRDRSGFGTAAVQGGIAIYRDRVSRGDSGAYLALRLAVMLEAYASECCDFYFSNANAIELPDEPYPAWQVELPRVPPFPEDTDAWRAMDKRLVARCLDFPNCVHASQNKIASCAEYAEHDLGNVLDEEASARGVEAWDIASALRDTYQLGRVEMVFDYFGVLRDVLKSSKENREEREKQHAQLMQKLSQQANVGS